MMIMPIFKQNLVATLWKTVDVNYELYMEGDFNDFLALPELKGQSKEVESLTVKKEELSKLIPESGGQNDAKNAYAIFSAFEDMTPNIANDERIWVAATHTYGIDFVRGRWLHPNRSREKNLKSIKAHFFARVDGTRGLHRNNAFSSLWWWAYIVHRGGKANFEKRLEVFLTATDIRANILERPSATRVPAVFEAIITCVDNKLEKEPDTNFFTRKRSENKNPPYRKWLQKVNLWGGKHLYNIYSTKELTTVFSGFIDEVELEIGVDKSI